MKEIYSMQLDTWMIGFTSTQLQIGCQSHTIPEWRDFSDEQIARMNEKALDWWKKWSSHIFKTIELV
jgi:hypothetical protein